jgi:hypothetical protein
MLLQLPEEEFTLYKATRPHLMGEEENGSILRFTLHRFSEVSEISIEPFSAIVVITLAFSPSSIPHSYFFGSYPQIN